MNSRLSIVVIALCFRTGAAFGLRHAVFAPRITSRLWRVSATAQIVATEALSTPTITSNASVDTRPSADSRVREGSISLGPSTRPVSIFPGDYVVHRDLGIGQFAKQVIKGNETMILLKFGEGATRLVGPEERSLVSRLKAADAASPPKLTQLTDKGLRAWRAKVESVRLNTKDLAQDILSLYATRNAIYRAPCEPDGDAFTAWAEKFAFTPTPDQITCFEECEQDMVHRTSPMDRLVVGDVGFGKTEVALRAVFRAVLNNRQVAFLAPTTVLASQHFRTIKKRLPGVNVVFLRGGASKSSEGLLVRELITNGTAQVVIGTHSLLYKSVEFKKLELLVVDEEQKFGVAQKERLKAMSTGIDCLTLSATPIPRTLQMSLSGIRDMSVIRTAPEGRKEIETIVAKYDESKIRNIVVNEMERQGQIFFVVPRIAQIDKTIEMLARVVPEASVLVAHGRQKDVEARIINFSEGGADVLVATSVIESGLDLPNANTIIVTEPHLFGLAALYQLRGRVGRSPRNAFAYFLYPRNESITTDALRRLQAIKELKKLGSGFELANRDLEIRGAGDIVGQQQSGDADKVGPEIFLSLLQEAMEEARGTNVTSVLDCQINLKAAKALVARGLPSDFVAAVAADVSEKAMMRKSPRDIVRMDKAWRELSPGKQLPPTVEAYLKIQTLKSCGRRLGIVEIATDKSGSDVILFVPGWTQRIWGHLLPFIEGVLGDEGGEFDSSTKQVRLWGLGEESMAKQLALLLSLATKLYIQIEGKENFGFE